MYNSPKTSPSMRPRSNSYTSTVRDFHVGSKVLIVETENVIQRAPHLVGKVGIVHEVPGMFCLCSFCRFMQSVMPFCSSSRDLVQSGIC